MSRAYIEGGPHAHLHLDHHLLGLFFPVRVFSTQLDTRAENTYPPLIDTPFPSPDGRFDLTK
jgi:hypothetical protein